ncbi:MAG: hypothetical protein ABFD69_15865 [Candidatus Sumerlaeia bacterium]
MTKIELECHAAVPIHRPARGQKIQVEVHQTGRQWRKSVSRPIQQRIVDQLETWQARGLVTDDPQKFERLDELFIGRVATGSARIRCNVVGQTGKDAALPGLEPDSRRDADPLVVQSGQRLGFAEVRENFFPVRAVRKHRFKTAQAIAVFDDVSEQSVAAGAEGGPIRCRDERRRSRLVSGLGIGEQRPNIPVSPVGGIELINARHRPGPDINEAAQDRDCENDQADQGDSAKQTPERAARFGGQFRGPLNIKTRVPGKVLKIFVAERQRRAELQRKFIISEP